jgi:hypothetical protein
VVGLSEDQKAMLRLLAQREQGYEDIAALMGISVEEVRERVKGALDQLSAEGDTPAAEALRPAGSVVQEDSSSSQAAGEAPSSTPPAGQSSAEPASGAAEPPRSAPPDDAERSVAAGPGAKKAAPTVPKLSLPESQGARAAIAAGVVALVVLVVVLALSGGSGSSDTTTASGTAPAGAEGEPTSGNVKQVTKAVLKPVGGAEGTGVAIFGRFSNSLALQVEAEGLKPTEKGHSYAIWLSESPEKMLPLASTAVGPDGRIAASFEVPTEVLGYLANETFDQIAVTETEDTALKASLDKATSAKKAPEYTGTEVLRGQITGPIIGVAKKAGN